MESIRDRKFSVVSILEMIEHLDLRELESILSFCAEMLVENRVILFSAPIEIWPVVLVKDLTRALLFRRGFENSIYELFRLAFFALLQGGVQASKLVIKDMISGGQ